MSPTIIDFASAKSKKAQVVSQKKVHRGETMKHDMKIALVDTLKYHGVDATKLKGMSTLFSMIEEVINHHVGDGSEIMEIIDATNALRAEIERVEGNRMI